MHYSERQPYDAIHSIMKARFSNIVMTQLWYTDIKSNRSISAFCVSWSGTLGCPQIISLWQVDSTAGAGSVKGNLAASIADSGFSFSTPFEFTEISWSGSRLGFLCPVLPVMSTSCLFCTVTWPLPISSTLHGSGGYISSPISRPHLVALLLLSA